MARQTADGRPGLGEQPLAHHPVIH
jgi:hypothetical protein